MAQAQPSNEWASETASPASGPAKSCTRAAVLLWVLGAIELLMFGGCGSAFILIAVMPIETIQQEFAKQPIHQQITLEQLRSWVPVIVGTILVLGILPALVYVISAFGVYAGKQGAINLALVVLMTQGIVLGIVLLTNFAGAIMAEDPIAITMNVLVFGSVMALIIAAIRALLTAREHDEDTWDEQTDPWNNNQT